MKQLGNRKQVFLATSAALSAALALAVTIAGCNSGNSSPIADAIAQSAPVVPVAPVVDIEKTQGTGPADTILFSGGGPATRIWYIDTKYHKIVAAINADGTDGRNLPVLTTAHNYTYPELHDNHSAVTNSTMTRIYGTVWGSYDEPSYAIEYDPKTLKETRRAPAGKGAHHSAISPDDKFLYVANQYEKFLSIIDVTTMTKLKDINLGAMVVYPSKTSYFWSTDAAGVSKRIPIPTKYIFVTVTAEPPVSNFVAAPVVPATNAVAVIDIATNTLVKMIPIGQSIHSVNLTTDGKEAWVSGATVTVIDTETLTIKTKIPYASTHQNFSPDGKYGYLTSSGGALLKIDRATYTPVWRASDGGSAHVQVSNDGSEIYTQGTNVLRYPYLLGGRAVAGIQVFSAVDGRLITEIPFNNGTHEMEIIPKTAVGVPAPAAATSGSALYVSNCQACHGVAGQGGAISEDLNTGTYFGKSALAVAVITAGRPDKGMPGFSAKLTSAQIQSIADYVATLK